MKHIILSSNKIKALEVAKKLYSMPEFNTYIGSCWGAVIAIFAALKEWKILNDILVNNNNGFSLLTIFSFKNNICISNYYTFTLHERLVDSDTQVRIPLLNLDSKELDYFILNRLSYKVAICVLKASTQSVWDKPVYINNSLYVEPSIFDSHCFYHILSHDKFKMPTSVDVIFPVTNNELTEENWSYQNSKTVLSRILYIIRLRNLKRCTYEIRTLAEANSVEINYNYLN